MRLRLAALALTFFSLPSLGKTPAPYRIQVIADENSLDRATSFQAYIKGKPPFSRLGSQVEVEVVSRDSSELACSNSCGQYQTSSRSVCCNADLLMARMKHDHVNRVVVFTSTASGGGGNKTGGYAVIGTGYPIAGGLHELMHSWGLEDEYAYSESEAKFYCGNTKTADRPDLLVTPNVTSFLPQKSYASDAEARRAHRAQIPWIDEIKPGTPVVNGALLGTPPGLPETEAGLYPNYRCPGIPTWVPYPRSTIMNHLETDWVSPWQEKLVLKALEKELRRTLVVDPAGTSGANTAPPQPTSAHPVPAN